MVGAGGDPATDALAGFARELGLSPATSPDLARLRTDKRFADASHPLVLVPDTGVGPLDVGAAADFAREHVGRGFVVCLADTIAPDDYKRLLRTGAADWIAWRDHREELRELVARLDGASAAASGRSATVLSFLPSKGGTGNTTLVVEAAFHLATRRKRSGARVAILDLNMQGGTVADALDVEPRFDVSEIVDRPERLDEQLIDIFTSRPSKSLHVFAGPMRRISTEAVKPEVVFTVVDSIAARYDTVLIDLPAHWSPWTDTLLRGSDAVVVCGGESVPALRRLTSMLGHLDGLALPPGRIAAVVNAATVDVLGRVTRRAVVERALAKRRTFFVRRDDASAGNALDVGRPLLEVAPHTRIARDLKQLAEWVGAVADQSLQAQPARGTSP